MRRLFLFVFFFISNYSLIATDNDYSTEVISVSQGLPNSQITSLHRGSQGLMWIGTTNGLCIYDGYRFTVLQSIAFDSNTFADDNIFLIKQDRNNNIWLSTKYGIEKYNIENGKSERIKFLGKTQSVIDILPSKNENFIYIIYKNSIEKVDIFNYSSEVIYISEGNSIFCAELEDNTIAFITSSEFVVLDLQNNTLQHSYHYKNIKTSDIIHTDSLWVFALNNNIYRTDQNKYDPKIIFEANQNINFLSGFNSGNMVFSTDNCVVQLEFYGDLHLKKTEKFLDKKDLKINHIFQNQDCLIWVASDQGLIKINPYSSRISHNRYFSSNHFYQNVVSESSDKGFIYKNQEGRTYFYNAIDNKHYALPVSNYTSICLINKSELLVGSLSGLFRINLKTGRKQLVDFFNNHEVYALYYFDDKLWISTDKGIYSEAGEIFDLICSHKINSFIATNGEIFYTDSNSVGVIRSESCFLHPLLVDSNTQHFIQVFDMLQSYDAKIWLATDDGLYRFNRETHDNEKVFELVFNGKVYSIIEAENLPEVWFACDMGIGSINYQNGQLMLLGYEDGIRNTSFLPTAVYYRQNGTLNFISNKEIISFNPDSIYRNSAPPEVIVSYISYVKNKEHYHKLFHNKDTIVLHPDIKFYELYLSTHDYFAPLNTRFEYSLELLSKPDDWIELSDNKLTIGGVDPGVYKLKVRAINSHGYKSKNNLEILFIIKAPLLQSKLAFLIYSILLIILILLLIQFRTRNLRRINREYKEKERIARKIELQKEELTIKNKNITDSINYARRIQLAMMPSAKNFNSIFPDSFILHMPKDIVSGDFYWVNEVSDKIFFSAVDCTGHGVPGAFMSIIGVELFRRITEIEKIYTPAEVLNSLSKHFDRVFGDVDEMKLRDGMDLAFCSLNADHTILEYAGAFNPLYIIRDNSIIEIKGDRNSVGVYHDEDEIRVFNNHVLPIQDQDLIYIFTDGFADQFGGPEEKKYKYRRFRHLLLALHQLPMNKQEEFLKKSILEWKGNLDQVDDILVMGIRIHHNV